jgi:hypothetical protein
VSTPQRVAIALSAAAVLVAPAVAQSRSSTVSATGVISGSGTSYTLTVSNTGTQAILCMQLVTAVGVVNVTAPTGSQTFVQGNRFGASNQQGLIAPGGTATFAFTTDQTYPANGGGDLHVSADCQNDVVSRATGPAVETQPPCRCITFFATIVPKSVFFLGAGELGHLHLEFDVAWTMTCTTGSGTCHGLFDLYPPQPAGTLGTKLKPLSGYIRCNGPCGAVTTGHQHFTLFGGKPLDSAHRKNKTIKLVMKRTCNDVQVRPEVFTIVFDKYGQVDKQKSDLNANGKPDLGKNK